MGRIVILQVHIEDQEKDLSCGIPGGEFIEQITTENGNNIPMSVDALLDLATELKLF